MSVTKTHFIFNPIYHTNKEPYLAFFNICQSNKNLMLNHSISISAGHNISFKIDCEPRKTQISLHIRAIRHRLCRAVQSDQRLCRAICGWYRIQSVFMWTRNSDQTVLLHGLLFCLLWAHKHSCGKFCALAHCTLWLKHL